MALQWGCRRAHPFFGIIDHLTMAIHESSIKSMPPDCGDAKLLVRNEHSRPVEGWEMPKISILIVNWPPISHRCRSLKYLARPLCREGEVAKLERPRLGAIGDMAPEWIWDFGRFSLWRARVRDKPSAPELFGAANCCNVSKEPAKQISRDAR